MFSDKSDSLNHVQGTHLKKLLAAAKTTLWARKRALSSVTRVTSVMAPDSLIPAREAARLELYWFHLRQNFWPDDSSMAMLL